MKDLCWASQPWLPWVNTNSYTGNIKELCRKYIKWGQEANTLQTSTNFPTHLEKAARISLKKQKKNLTLAALSADSPSSLIAPFLTFDVIQLRGCCPTVWLLRAHAQVAVWLTLFLWMHSWAWWRREDTAFNTQELQLSYAWATRCPGTSQPSQQLSVLARKLLFTGRDGWICCRGNATAGTRLMGLLKSLQADNKWQGQKQMHFVQTADSQWSNVNRDCHHQEESQQYPEWPKHNPSKGWPGIPQCATRSCVSASQRLWQ